MPHRIKLEKISSRHPKHSTWTQKRKHKNKTHRRYKSSDCFIKTFFLPWHENMCVFIQTGRNDGAKTPRINNSNGREGGRERVTYISSTPFHQQIPRSLLVLLSSLSPSVYLSVWLSSCVTSCFADEARFLFLSKSCRKWLLSLYVKGKSQASSSKQKNKKDPAEGKQKWGNEWDKFLLNAWREPKSTRQQTDETREIGRHNTAVDYCNVWECRGAGNKTDKPAPFPWIKSYFIITALGAKD